VTDPESPDQPGSPDRPDVVRIMKEIREAIQRKRAQGHYTDEEVESLAALRLRSFGEEAKIDERLLERLLGPNHDWNIAVDYVIRTTRTGLGARILVLVKKMVRPLVRLYTDHVLGRQAQINLYLTHVLQNNVRETARLQLENQALRYRCEALERAAGLRPGERPAERPAEGPAGEAERRRDIAGEAAPRR
jgi:hypothetical protein